MGAKLRRETRTTERSVSMKRSVKKGRRRRHAEGNSQAIVAAARAEIERRASLLEELEKLDPDVASHAIQTFESATAAAEWLVSSGISTLGNRTPIELVRTSSGRKRLLAALGTVEHGVFT